MIRSIIITTIFFLGVFFGASALEVETEAGSLHERVGENTDAAELVLSGSVDAADFEFIHSSMAALEHLDMGAATVTTGVLPECALMCPKLESVVLPVGLKAIGAGALGGTALKSVVIPEGVESIGNGAFGNCRQLAGVIVPASVKSLGKNVFKDCISLKNAVIDAAVETLPDGMFQGCVALENVELPSGIRHIGDSSFAGCGALKRIGLPASVETIADKAFFATGLEELDLTGCEHLTHIGKWAFASIPSLTSVAFGNALAELGNGAFFNDVAVGDAVSLESTSVSTIGDYALAGWEKAVSVSLPESLEHMGDMSMAGWTLLRQISGAHLSGVPLLGKDVWHGVEQENVDLFVPLNVAEAFRDTPQWMEFNIVTESSGTEVVSNNVDGSTLSVWFDGDMLIVEAPSEIASLSCFDVQGREYHLPFNIDATSAKINCSAFSGSLLLVRVLLTDGTIETLKLLRQ